MIDLGDHLGNWWRVVDLLSALGTDTFPRIRCKMAITCITSHPFIVSHVFVLRFVLRFILRFILGFVIRIIHFGLGSVIFVVFFLALSFSCENRTKHKTSDCSSHLGNWWRVVDLLSALGTFP
ncbi:hypothetical protein EhV308A [Emiliania huxleyi virus 86]|uniref:Uncharacterized protein n=1 Tax=Emiliania huxleyi virus 86 (isolate United Kingdom/English Channel/1999) TaxID=654925 RepID=Q4A2H1_EHV8U|nr:hypothetical protein EhV308A [Emiliania huxleyi virus 86]CAI65735.1 hypothetical protein EhV308A [Emiliania huxleyi virus 86]